MIYSIVCTHCGGNVEATPAAIQRHETVCFIRLHSHVCRYCGFLYKKKCKFLVYSLIFIQGSNCVCFIVCDDNYCLESR